MKRGPAKSGAEQDVIGANGRARRYYCYLTRAGATSGIKRQMRRRERKDGRAQLRRDPENA